MNFRRSSKTKHYRYLMCCGERITTEVRAVCVHEKFVLKIQLFTGNRHDVPE